MTRLFSYYVQLVPAGKSAGEISMDELVEIIRDGKEKIVVDQLRTAQTKEVYDELKKFRLSCVALSGTFSHRSTENLILHSGLIQIDIDNVDTRQFTSVFDALSGDQYTMCCFRSPGGRGIKVVVKINPSAESHLGQFYALERYYKDNFDITVDTSCKDVCRAMLLSYDPQIYYNPLSAVFDKMYKPEANQRKANNPLARSVHFYSQSDDKTELVEAITSELEDRGIDITSSYINWRNIGFALCDALGSAGLPYFHRISDMHPGYELQECAHMYDNLLQSHKTGITIGTLIYLAAQKGIEIEKPERRTN